MVLKVLDFSQILLDFQKETVTSTKSMPKNE